MNNIQKGGIFFLDISDLMIILFIVSLSTRLLTNSDNNNDDDNVISKNKQENYDLSNIINSIRDKEKKSSKFKLDINFKKELLKLLNTKEDDINVQKKIDEIYDLFKK